MAAAHIVATTQSSQNLRTSPSQPRSPDHHAALLRLRSGGGNAGRGRRRGENAEVWEGVRAITDYKGRTSPPVNSSAPLAEELNIFYARFDRNNKDPVWPPLPYDGSNLGLSTHEVRLILRNINIRKAAGPDGVQGRVLKDCAAELAPVLTTIFNLSLGPRMSQGNNNSAGSQETKCCRSEQLQACGTHPYRRKML